MGKQVLIIHGGAGAREGHHTTFQLYGQSLDRIVEEAWPILQSEGSRAAVLHAIRLLENDPVFNAGMGSRLQRDGHVRMSAALMDGVGGRFSGVVNVEDVEHPIDIAAALADRLGGSGRHARADPRHQTCIVRRRERRGGGCRAVRE